MSLTYGQKIIQNQLYGSVESRAWNILFRSLLYFDYSRTEEISLDKNFTTKVTQDGKNEEEPSDEESQPSMGTPTQSRSNKEQKTLGYRKRFRRNNQRCPEQSLTRPSRCKGRAQVIATQYSNDRQGRLSRLARTAIWIQLVTFARSSFCLGKVLFKFSTSSADIGTDFLQSKFSIHFFKIKIKDNTNCEVNTIFYGTAFK